MKTEAFLQRIIKETLRQTTGEGFRKRRHLHKAMNPMEVNFGLHSLTGLLKEKFSRTPHISCTHSRCLFMTFLLHSN